MSEAVSQGETEWSEGRARVWCCRDQLLPVGNIRFNEPQKKKTGFDVVESSPKNGEQVRMPGGKRRKKPTRN